MTTEVKKPYGFEVLQSAHKLMTAWNKEFGDRGYRVRIDEALKAIEIKSRDDASQSLSGDLSAVASAAGSVSYFGGQ